jgi:hypothetical protein
MSRVTRVGEFSPMRRLFTLGSFFENYRWSPNNWDTLFHSKSYVFTLQKMGRAIYLVIFSKTHLVTLSMGYIASVAKTYNTSKQPTYVVRF